MNLTRDMKISIDDCGRLETDPAPDAAWANNMEEQRLFIEGMSEYLDREFLCSPKM